MKIKSWRPKLSFCFGFIYGWGIANLLWQQWVAFYTTVAVFLVLVIIEIYLYRYANNKRDF
jgi:hypothetical protein